MSYCRFMSGDVYLYPDVGGFICCCACRLAPMVNTVFTKGNSGLFGVDGPCDRCGGDGCGACQMHGSLEFYKYSDAIAHLKEHEANGHSVPQYAFDRLLMEQERDGDKFGEAQ